MIFIVRQAPIKLKLTLWMKVQLLILVIVGLMMVVSGQISDKIKGNLKENTKTEYEVMVYLKKVESQVAEPQRSDYETRGEWIAAKVNIMEAEAEKARKPVMEILNAPEYVSKITIQTFWIVNRVSITKAPFELLTKLADLDQVEKIVEPTVAHIQDEF